MNAPVVLTLGVLVALLIWSVAKFNVLVRLRNMCRESWSGIDTELKRRYELIPNLVAIVRGYAQHEHDTLEEVTAARNRALASTGSPTAQAQDENVLVGAIRQLVAVSERYPDLKANEHFLSLMGELVNTEDRIQAARRFYNANVRDLNTRIEVFPSNLVARTFGFTVQEYFEIEDTGVRRPPEVTIATRP
jgi:LemA protein